MVRLRVHHPRQADNADWEIRHEWKCAVNEDNNLGSTPAANPTRLG
jgi:hypothetical protein